ncbi:MAG: N-6 DNA methylase [Egibacteraceae bacterium]
MSAAETLATARQVLAAVGYADDAIASGYPVWLGRGNGVAAVEFVAFGRSAPRDMSTALVAVTSDALDRARQVAETIATPYFMVASGNGLDLWVAGGEQPWIPTVGLADVDRLRAWLRPAVALRAKVGLRQLPLFDLPVNFLAAARSRSAEQLAPIVGEALEAATDALVPTNVDAKPGQGKRYRHSRAALLVVGALTTLVIRDRGMVQAAGMEDLIDAVARQHPSSFNWFEKSSRRERAILVELVSQLGSGIDYQSLDPSILSHVYEQALVNEDDRKRLGIHYTPPRLAAQLLNGLPVELVAPENRHVLDPACGSGTLLVAAHDRLRDLQPVGWTEEDRHRDLAVHLQGFDIDPFAVEIARLTLLLHAQPAGNGWRIISEDTLQQPAPSPPPHIIVSNPPWEFSSGGKRSQKADQFMTWSMRTLAPGGLLGILLPGSWMTADSSASVREELLETFEVFEMWRLPEGTFPTSGVSTTAVLARRRGGLSGRGARVVREVDLPGLPEFLTSGIAKVTYVLPGGSGTPLAQDVH